MKWRFSIRFVRPEPECVKWSVHFRFALVWICHRAPYLLSIIRTQVFVARIPHFKTVSPHVRICFSSLIVKSQLILKWKQKPTPEFVNSLTFLFHTVDAITEHSSHFKILQIMIIAVDSLLNHLINDDDNQHASSMRKLASFPDTVHSKWETPNVSISLFLSVSSSTVHLRKCDHDHQCVTRCRCAMRLHCCFTDMVVHGADSVSNINL